MRKKNKILSIKVYIISIFIVAHKCNRLKTLAREWMSGVYGVCRVPLFSGVLATSYVY